MATDVLPATHIIDDDTPVAAARSRTLAAARKPSMLRRLYDAIVETQTRRAQREIARVLVVRF